MTTIIRAAHYGETEERLTKDPIIIEMIKGLKGTPLDKMTHDDGTPRFEFMQASNREYTKRGGKDGGHIGAVASALLKLLKEPEPTKPVLTDAQELASIKRFVEAGVARGKTLMDAALEEFDRTGESGYTEGDAAGFSRAFKLVLDFIENREGDTR